MSLLSPKLRSSPLFALIALLLGCSPPVASTTRDVPSSGAVVAVRIEAGTTEFADLTLVLSSLPPGRYAAFVSERAPEDAQAVVTFDPDVECPTSTVDGGAGSARAGAARAPFSALSPTCTATGIFEGGTSGQVATFDVIPPSKGPSTTSFKSPYAGVVFLTVRPLGSAKLETLRVRAETDASGGCSETPPPTVDPVALK